MAKLDPVPFAFKGQDHNAEIRELDELQVVSDALPANAIVGALIRFHVADGYAFYRVTAEAPLTVQHVPFLDGYAIAAAHVRGLEREDILEQLALRKRFDHVTRRRATS